MKRIRLTQGEFAIVDDEDYEWLSQWKWRCQRTSKSATLKYAVRQIRLTNPRRGKSGKRLLISMHREILDLNKGDPLTGDHIDGNGLNNQRVNLRVCTLRQNLYNQRPKLNRNKYIPYKGVHLLYNSKNRKRFIAVIKCKKKQKHLGTFDSPEEAARGYDKAAIRYFGEFARLNFPLDNRRRKT